MARVIFIFKGKAKDFKKALAPESDWSKCFCNINMTSEKIITLKEGQSNVF